MPTEAQIQELADWIETLPIARTIFSGLIDAEAPITVDYAKQVWLSILEFGLDNDLVKSAVETWQSITDGA